MNTSYSWASTPLGIIHEKREEVQLQNITLSFCFGGHQITKYKLSVVSARCGLKQYCKDTLKTSVRTGIDILESIAADHSILCTHLSACMISLEQVPIKSK